MCGYVCVGEWGRVGGVGGGLASMRKEKTCVGSCALHVRGCPCLFLSPAHASLLQLKTIMIICMPVHFFEWVSLDFLPGMVELSRNNVGQLANCPLKPNIAKTKKMSAFEIKSAIV